MDTETAIKFAAGLGSVIASAKIALEIARSRKPRIREDYQFAKEFFSDYTSDTPDLMVELGYAALTGDASLGADEVRHFLSKRTSLRLLEKYSSGRRFLAFSPAIGDVQSRVDFKGKYKSRMVRWKHQRWHMTNYLVFAMLALSPLIWGRRLFPGDISTWLVVSMACLLGLGWVAWDCMRSYIRMAHAEHVMKHEDEP